MSRSTHRRPFWAWLRWRLDLANERDKVSSCFECGMGHTVSSDAYMKSVFMLEQVGVTNGWLLESDRTVRIGLPKR